MPEFWSGRCRLFAALAVLGPMLGGLLVGALDAIDVRRCSARSSSAAADSNASAADTPPANFECPSVAVRQGAATLFVSANPAEPSPMNLRYQVAIGDTARECRLAGRWCR